MTYGFQSFPAIEFDSLTGPVRLAEDLQYIARDGRRFTVPAGTRSDLESRPTILPGPINWLLGDFLSTAASALLHDHLYQSQIVTRREADALYYEALRSTGKGFVGANLAWFGLRLGGWAAWRGHSS